MRRLIVLLVLLVCLASRAFAQPQISYITPDAAAPGMTVAVEFIGPFDKPGNFGADGVYNPGQLVQLGNTIDTKNIILGPAVVSWNGRMIQAMVMVRSTTPTGTTIPLVVVTSAGKSSNVGFLIVTPTHIGAVSGGGVLGQGSLGSRTKHNTMVIDGMTLQNGVYSASTVDPDATTPGNEAYLPLRILSQGPVVISQSASITVDGANAVTANPGSGGNGGPGGGGGGGGMPANGGDGFTGGGGIGENSNPSLRHGGVGSGTIHGSNYWDGGLSLNGVPGGFGMEHNGNSFDEGGGGGTGHPFGTSGQTGRYKTASATGGFGAASGGGTDANTSTDNYGGGGAGNATDGSQGVGTGNNAGLQHGNPMQIPFAGGSGGASGNVSYYSLQPFIQPGAAGNGGGGGGAVDITSFQDLSVVNATISAKGGNGSNGLTGTSNNGAGGGAGSGGAISLTARDSITIGTPGAAVVFNLTGGIGGSGYKAGGNGAVGRVRINGEVSRTGNSSTGNYFTPAKDYVGPTIQSIKFTKTTFTISGYSSAWNGAQAISGPITIYYFVNSLGAWQQTTATPVNSASSFTASWTTTPITLPTGATDTEVMAVALQPNANPISGTFVDVPAFSMSHTSGIIAAIPGSPKLLVKTTTIDFGKVRVGKCSNDTTVTIYSIGKADLAITGLSISGADASQFNLKTSPKIIRIGDSLLVTLSFCPTVRQCPFNATLHITSNDINADVALTGCGIQPAMAQSPAVLDFGRVRAGICIDSFYSVTNTGTDDLIINRESLGDPHFTSLTALPDTVKPGITTSLWVRYCPNDTTLTITGDTVVSDAPESPVQFIVRGGGLEGILAAPATLDFGSVHKGSCKDSTILLTNLGNDTLAILSHTFGDNRFSLVTPGVPFLIAPHSSDSVTLRYCSNDTGSVSTTDKIHGDYEPDSTIRLFAHTGFGIFSLNSSIDFGLVDVGSCKDTLVVIANAGTDSLIVDSLPNLPSVFSLAAPTLPIRLGAGEAQQVTLRYCPLDTSRTVSLDTAAVQDPSRTAALTLIGKGVKGALSLDGPIDFGCVTEGTPARKTLHVTNSGTGSIANLNSSIAGSAAISIILSPHPSLGIGQSDSVILQVNPTQFGYLNATVTLTYNSSSVTVPVTAHVSPAPKITLLDSVVVFDTVGVDSISATQCVRVTNYSCEPLDASKFVVSNPQFEIVPGDLTSLHDSNQSTLCIRYHPNRNGADSGIVRFVIGTDTIGAIRAYGYGRGTTLGVMLTMDTVYGRPGEIVRASVRLVNDITPAGADSIRFRVQFDPMQLDLKAPELPGSNSGKIILSKNQALSTISDKRYSLGDHEITIAASSALTGSGVIAALPFELLMPTNNSVAIKLLSASFGSAPATLVSAANGMVVIEQCDTTERVSLTGPQVTVSQNYPNPYDKTTSIDVTTSASGRVTVAILNLLGEVVMSPFDQDVKAGTTRINIDGSKLKPGTYIYRTLWTGPFTTSEVSKKMTIQ